MRKFVVAACLFLGVAALVPSAIAAVDANLGQIQSLVAKYPAGGPDLTSAIATALEGDPSLADDMVAVSQTASKDQQDAIGIGIAQAVNYYGNLHTKRGDDAVAEILEAAKDGPAELLASIDANIEPTAGGPNGTPFGQLVSQFVHSQQQISCVSPNRPGQC